MTGGGGWRVLVCGGRAYADSDRLFSVLDGWDIAEMCHGGAAGADTLAGIYAAARGVPCRVFPADWRKHGRAAGALRNLQMLREFEPEFVIAFPGGRGTAHMVKAAADAGVQVLIAGEADWFPGTDNFDADENGMPR